jgi:hypothetical protein
MQAWFELSALMLPLAASVYFVVLRRYRHAAAVFAAFICFRIVMLAWLFLTHDPMAHWKLDDHPIIADSKWGVWTGTGLSLVAVFSFVTWFTTHGFGHIPSWRTSFPMISRHRGRNWFDLLAAVLPVCVAIGWQMLISHGSGHGLTLGSLLLMIMIYIPIGLFARLLDTALLRHWLIKTVVAIAIFWNLMMA